MLPPSALRNRGALVACGVLALATALTEILDTVESTSDTDYYSLLGVTRSFDDQQLRKAYRKAARKYHPDVNKSPEAQEMFIKITKAYETLSDPSQRQIYDRFGEEGLSKGGSGAQESPFSTHSFHFPSGSAFHFEFPSFESFFDEDEDQADSSGGFFGHHFGNFGSVFGSDTEQDLFADFPGIPNFGRQANNAHARAHARAFQNANGQHSEHLKSHFAQVRRAQAQAHEQAQAHARPNMHTRTASPSSSNGGGGQRCVTTTEQHGNVITQRTECH